MVRSLYPLGSAAGRLLQQRWSPRGKHARLPQEWTKLRAGQELVTVPIALPTLLGKLVAGFLCLFGAGRSVSAGRLWAGYLLYACAAILLLLALRSVPSLWRSLKGRRSSGGAVAQRALTLPPELTGSQSEETSTADELARQGRYREALIFLEREGQEYLRRNRWAKDYPIELEERIAELKAKMMREQGEP